MTRMSNKNTENTDNILQEIIIRHIDTNQKLQPSLDSEQQEEELQTATLISTKQAVLKLKQELESQILNDTFKTSISLQNNEINYEKDPTIKAKIITSIQTVIDTTFATIINKKNKDDGVTTIHKLKSSSYYESIHCILDFIASFSILMEDNDNTGQGGCNNNNLAKTILNHMDQYTTVNMESVRVLVCYYVGRYILYLSDYYYHHHEQGNSRNNSYNDSHYQEELFHMACDILCPRLEDKSQAVRNAAIESCGHLFWNDYHQSQWKSSHKKRDNSIDDNMKEEKSEILNDNVLHYIKNEIIQGMLYNLMHDPSFANRALTVKNLPLYYYKNSDDGKPLKSMNTIPHIIQRINDSKCKVRVDTLHVLKDRVHFIQDLNVNQRIEILRLGLTDRCSETYKATIQLLCCNWMKTMKFDPIETIRNLLQLDTTQPSSDNKNENICRRATQAILAAASKDYDCIAHTNTTKNNDSESSLSEMALVDLSDNEKQAFREIVLQRNGNISIKDANNNDDETGKEVSSSNEQQPQNIIDPSTILFLCVLCDVTINSTSLSEVKRSNILSRTLPDIPTLGEMLERHLGYLNQCLTTCDNQINESTLDVNDEDAEQRTHDTREDAICFICLQLLRLVQYNTDLNEEGSRRHLKSILQQMLCCMDTPVDLIEDSVHVLACCYDTKNHFLQAMSEILADIIIIVDSSTKDNNSNGDDEEERKNHYLRAMEILSIALEKTPVQQKIATNPIFQNFSQCIVTAITDTNLGLLVREMGVSCLGRYAILLDEVTVINTFKGLLMNIAFLSKDEKNEIRAQAILAVTDLTVLFDLMVKPISLKDIIFEEESGIKLDKEKEDYQSNGDDKVSVSDLLLQTIASSLRKNRALAIVAAECAAKLIFANKIHDVNILAYLLMVYFDPEIGGSNSGGRHMDEAYEDVEEVGSPTRLQQLLSVFFPAYGMQSEIGRDILMASIEPLLGLVYKENYSLITSDGCGKKKKITWPIAKMMEYICETVEVGKNNHNSGNKGKAKGDPAKKENDDKILHNEPSATLLMAIAISKFLIKEGDNIQTSHLRSLSKILGSTYIDVETEERALLRVLKGNVDELAMIVTDDLAIRSLETVVCILDDVIMDDDCSDNGERNTDISVENDDSCSECDTELEEEGQISYEDGEPNRKFEESEIEEEEKNGNHSKRMGEKCSHTKRMRKNEVSLLEGFADITLNEKGKDSKESAKGNLFHNRRKSSRTQKKRVMIIESERDDDEAVQDSEGGSSDFSSCTEEDDDDNSLLDSLGLTGTKEDKTKPSSYSTGRKDKATSRVFDEYDNIPLFASIGEEAGSHNQKNNHRTLSNQTIRKQANHKINESKDDSTESEASDNLNDDLSEDDSPVVIRRKKTDKIQKQMVIESEDSNVSYSGKSSSSEYDSSSGEDLSSCSSSSDNINNKVRNTSPLRRKGKRKGRTPMRPRRTLREVNY